MARAVNNITKRTVKEKYFMAFGLAFIVACALFVPYIIWDKGYFIFYGDFNAQQIPFYKLAHAAVRNLDIGWSFGTDLGSNFVSSYSFYLLGSPFFWLTIPFPNDFVPHLMGPLLILKFSFASLTAYAYITRFVKNKNYAVLGAFMYAFSGFSVYNIFFNHFHEAIIFFPLLLLLLVFTALLTFPLIPMVFGIKIHWINSLFHWRSIRCIDASVHCHPLTIYLYHGGPMKIGVIVGYRL